MGLREKLEGEIKFLLHSGITLNEFLEEVEKIAIKEALKLSGGKIKEAARILGIHRNTLTQKMKKYKIRKK